MTWISIEDELPPCDGEYKVRQRVHSNKLPSASQEYAMRKFFYDGFGFKSKSGIYKKVLFWKKEEPFVKRYGPNKDPRPVDPMEQRA